MNDSDRQPSQDRPPGLRDSLHEAIDVLARVVSQRSASLRPRETGWVTEVERGIARVAGLPKVQSEELLRFARDRRGFAFNLDRQEVGCVLLDESRHLQSGTRVERTGTVLSVPVGEQLLGRVVDPLGRPLDGGRRLTGATTLPCEQDAPAIMQRAPVTVPLQTGIKVIDALVPIGHGQRQLILGDRQTGKTAVAVDTLINQRQTGVVCIYCAIGQRSTNVARVIANLRRHEALAHSIVVIGANDAPPGLQFVAPYAATSMGEFFREQGRDVLVVYDDLTAHARAYRHVSLMLRRPPGREAYPGDIFYVHSRLLERSAQLRQEAGGGSLTALPIVETEAQDVSAYIPTNLISITDGQVYLSPRHFRKGILPAVDVGHSVSRVGGKTQLPAYRIVAGDLRLTYSQFEELEKFARFSSRLDEETRRTLQRGRRVRETLKQPQFHLLDVPRQVASLVAVNSGILDRLDPRLIGRAETLIHQAVEDQLPETCRHIFEGRELSADDLEELGQVIGSAVDDLVEGGQANADPE